MPRVLVLGDVILDRYVYGEAERVSPEAPVLVVRADSEETRLGGGASVARLLRGLEADVLLAGVVGDDATARIVRDLLHVDGVDGSLVLSDSSRPTTTKERLIGRAANRHLHQIVRVDREVRTPLDETLQQRLAGLIADRLPECQAVLISDYAKGVCTPQLLATVISAAKRLHVRVLVDPARIADYSRYQGCDLMTPNRVEVEMASGVRVACLSDAATAGKSLCDKFDLSAVLVTLDKDGMLLVSGSKAARTESGCGGARRLDQPDETAGGQFSNGNRLAERDGYIGDGYFEHFPTRPREVYDITGAGDMVLAMLGHCLAEGRSLPDAIRLANIAAGLEVERQGVAPVSWTEILAECQHDRRPMAADKLVTLDAMAALAESYRQTGRRVVFTNGCFDLLHVGHVSLLQEAARLGDVLIIAVNSDASVRRVKGPSRPVIVEQDRATMLASLGCVSHVLVFEEDTPHELLRRIRPDVLAKGGTTAEIVGREIVEGYGGQVMLLSQFGNNSTTNIVHEIQKRSDHHRGSNNPRSAQTDHEPVSPI